MTALVSLMFQVDRAIAVGVKRCHGETCTLRNRNKAYQEAAAGLQEYVHAEVQKFKASMNEENHKFLSITEKRHDNLAIGLYQWCKQLKGGDTGIEEVIFLCGSVSYLCNLPVCFLLCAVLNTTTSSSFDLVDGSYHACVYVCNG